MTVDLTEFAISLVGGLLSLIGSIAVYLINARMKDRAAADTLSNAVRNSIGIFQQVTVGAIKADHPTVEIPGLPPAKATALQYVLDHAALEADRFGITQEALLDKITAQIGLSALNNAVVPTPQLGPGGLRPVPIASAIPVPPDFVTRSFSKGPDNAPP